MKTLGIITDYNPFHKGHAYMLEKATQKAEADRVVVIMSGSFVQRGEPAVFDKWTRTAAALKNGADLVLELPVLFAAAHAETFSRGAVRLLTESGILTVVGENRIRGTVESIYSLNKSALEIDDDGTVVQTALLGLSASFARYFSGGGADPRRDMLLMTTCTLTLTDEEFTGFLTEINQTALKYMDIGVKEGSRQRQITLISSLTDGPGSR